MPSKDPKSEKKEPVAVLHDATTTPRDGRKARGEVLRSVVPYKSHAEWSVHPDRPDPVEMLQLADKGRIAELLPIRYGRMLKTPFTFYRGAANIMAYDLSHTPDIKVKVQACGDSHALNFGAFATPERNIVIDINDFDETLPGPWEWDLKRLATSLVLIARDNELKAKEGAEAAEAAVKAYRAKMAELSKMSVLDIWYAKVEWENVLAESPDQQLKKVLQEGLKKAKKRSIQSYYFPKMTHEESGNYFITDTPPLIYHVKNDKSFVQRMHEGLELYRSSLQEDKQRLFERYKVCDIAIKVVGVGSVGTTCAIALLMAPDNEPLFLQLKEARESVLEPYGGKSTFFSHGQRVVAGQRIIQSASDVLLGWMELSNGQHFYVRQLRDTKIKLVPEDWDGKQLVSMAKVMGEVLARAHARSGDSAVIHGYLGDSDEFDRAIADFANSYADQAEKDHAALTAAVRSGRVKVEEDV